MPGPPDLPGSFRFSTAGLPAEARRGALGELRERGLLPIEALPDAAPSVRIAKRFLPEAGILSGTVWGARQKAAAHTGDELFLCVNLAGRSVASQGPREVAFGDGEAVLLNAGAGPFVIDRPTPARFMALRVPRPAIAPLLCRPEDPAMRLVPGRSDALRLLAAYLGMLADTPSVASPDVERAVAAHLHDLVALTLGATRDGAAAAAGSVRAARLQAIKSEIAARSADASLSIAGIAAHHGVTARYVHKLFETEGETYGRFVLRQRLDRAYRMLRDERLRARSITSIAFDAGFGDLSYFNRVFRRRFDATPSDIRSRILPPECPRRG